MRGIINIEKMIDIIKANKINRYIILCCELSYTTMFVSHIAVTVGNDFAHKKTYLIFDC